MLRFAQHDKGENVIPNASEESSMDASRTFQHDRFELPSLKSHKKYGGRNELPLRFLAFLYAF
jgi:hypothetical protein